MYSLHLNLQHLCTKETGPPEEPMLATRTLNSKNMRYLQDNIGGVYGTWDLIKLAWK